MGLQDELKRARAEYAAGRYQNALAIYGELLDRPGKRKSSNKTYFQLLVEMGRVLRRLARYSEAEKVLKQSLSVLPGLKDDAVSRAEALQELGLLYIEQSRFQEAEASLLEVLGLRSGTLAEDHMDIAEAHNNLGLLAWSRGDDARAEELYLRALAIRGAKVGKESHVFAETLDNMGALYQRTDRLADSKKAHSEALAIRERNLGGRHPDVGYSLVNLAAVHQKLDELDDVEHLLKRAIDIWTETLGAEHHHTAVAINNLGGYYLEQGRIEDANLLFEKSLRSLEAVLGSDNPALIAHVHNLSTVCRKQNRLDEAKKYEDRIQTLMLKKLSMEGGGGTQNLLLHAHSLQTIKDYDQAAQCLVKALDLAESEFGANSLRAAYILDFLGSNSVKQKNIEKAREYFNRSLAIKSSSLGADHSDVAATEQNLRFLSALKAEQNAASVLFQREDPSLSSRSSPRQSPEFAHLKALNLSQYNRVVVLTGAGISVASGLRTYRGPGGLWDEGDTQRVSHVDILTEEPEIVWPFFGGLRKRALAAQPNAAHRALFEWEARLTEPGCFTLVTQNVDGLHHRAGSKNVLELHGSVCRTRCSNPMCKLSVFEDAATYPEPEAKPLCAQCGAMLRPDIVFFGEPINYAVQRSVRQALMNCDLFLAVGTSGTVAPACDFVFTAREMGAHTILINLEEMPQATHYYHHEILGKAEEILPALVGSSY